MLLLNFFFFQIPLTLWGLPARDMTRFSVGNILELKGIVVENREGRACLKTTSRSEVLVIIFAYFILMYLLFFYLLFLFFLQINSKSVAAAELKNWSDDEKKKREDAKTKASDDENKKREDENKERDDANSKGGSNNKGD